MNRKILAVLLVVLVLGGCSFWNTEFVFDFTFQPLEPEVGEQIIFTAESEEDYDYTWDIAGSQLEGEIVTHTFQESSKYLVKLTATDINGDTDTLTKIIEVKDIQISADFSVIPGNRPLISKKVTFDAEGVGDDFYWNFDYTGSLPPEDYSEWQKGRKVIHRYEDGGEKVVILAVEAEGLVEFAWKVLGVQTNYLEIVRIEITDYDEAVGEVSNPTSHAWVSCYATAKFYNENDDLIETGEVSLSISEVNPLLPDRVASFYTKGDECEDNNNQRAERVEIEVSYCIMEV